MILVDTSVWVDHLARGDAALSALLAADAVLMHPCVIGEIALGSLKGRGALLELLNALPGAAVAQDSEVLEFVEVRKLYGAGIGYVDAHLLASVALAPGSLLWTRDKRLLAAADSLHCAYRDSGTH